MKKTITITSTLFISIFIFCLSAFAQFSRIGDFVASGLDDGGKLTAAYLKPYTSAVGYGLNAAWFNTAKPHKLLGFNLDFTANVVSVPSSDKSFDINSLGLSTMKVTGSSITPTVAGKSEFGPEISLTSGGNKIASYQMPKGLNWGYVPMPVAQLSIGLVKGTEIMARYIPTVKIGSTGNVGLWGIGVKHSLKQWIPAINKLPLIHLAAMVGYTQLNSSADINVTPDMVGSTDVTNGKIDFSNQKLDLTIKSLTANGIFSLDLVKLLVVYAGVGMGYTMTDFKLKGNYPIPNPNNYNISASRSEIVGNTAGTKQDIYSDPLNVKIKPGMQPRLNLGVRLKFAVITFNVEYVYSYYSIVTAGLGVNVR